jgi:hypothetical protein
MDGMTIRKADSLKNLIIDDTPPGWVFLNEKYALGKIADG